MFTGIVEELGTVAVRDGAAAAHQRARPCSTTSRSATRSRSTAAASPSSTGSSDGWWAADVVDETLARTNLGALRPGDPVNLERPVRLERPARRPPRAGPRRRASARSSTPAPDLRVRDADRDLLRYVVEKGSITVDGISLTVVDAARRRLHRRRHPAHRRRSRRSGRKGPGDRVNLEVDVIAKYVERLLGLEKGAPDMPFDADRGRGRRHRHAARSSSSSTTRTARTRATSSWRPRT